LDSSKGLEENKGEESEKESAKEMSVLSDIIQSLTERGETSITASEIEFLLECGVRVPRSVLDARGEKRGDGDWIEISNRQRTDLLKALGFGKHLWGRYRGTVERVYETRIDCKPKVVSADLIS